LRDYLLEDFRAAEAHLREQETLLAASPAARVDQALGAYQRARDAFDTMGGEMLHGAWRACWKVSACTA
jgi:hypothetical protein